MPGADNFLSLSPVTEIWSAPQSRSPSLDKDRRRPQRAQDRQGSRPRTHSLPSRSPRVGGYRLGEGEGGLGRMERDGRLCRVRSFKVTPKGLVNHGDSVLMRTSLASFRSSGSLTSSSASSSSSTTTTTDLTPHSHRPRTLSIASQASSSVGTSGGSRSSFCAPSFFRVALLGAAGVGKSALVRQFMSSEYRGTFDVNTPDADDKEHTVSVILDGEESVIEFIDDPQESEWESVRADAFVVVFSLADQGSYRWAQGALQQLRGGLGLDRAILLVGNKVDLARQRKVTTRAARVTSFSHECQYYLETSAALHHHVDDLLVAVLTLTRHQLLTPLPLPSACTTTTLSLHPGHFSSLPPYPCEAESPLEGGCCSPAGPRKAWSLLSKLFCHAERKAKSWDSLVGH